MTQYEEVLAFCNHIRTSVNLPPVRELEKGKRGSPCLCPIARTIGLGITIDGGYAYFGGGGGCWTLPEAVHDFIRKFDSGYYYTDLDLGETL